MKIKKRAILSFSTIVVLACSFYKLKTFNDYELRRYVDYDLYQHPANSDAIIVVYTCNHLECDDKYPYIATKTANGNISLLKNQFLPGAVSWSKDGSILAFKNALHVPTEAKNDSIPVAITAKEFEKWEKDRPIYNFAYDFSTQSEIHLPLSGWELSKHIGKSLKQHGGVSKQAHRSKIVISVAEQKKFEEADVNPYFNTD